jgi:hypothetical protein
VRETQYYPKEKPLQEGQQVQARFSGLVYIDFVSMSKKYASHEHAIQQLSVYT